MAEVICPCSCSTAQSPLVSFVAQCCQFCSFSTSMEVFGTERCLQVISEFVGEPQYYGLAQGSLCFKDADGSLCPARLYRAMGCVLTV